MIILINDANILIDIAALGLINSFSQLGFDLRTTDVVLNEVRNRKSDFDNLISSSKLHVIETTNISDYQSIFNLKENNDGLSFEDCSVWYYSDKLGGTLLTGDGALRKKASKSGTTVRGIIYIFDEFVSKNVLSFSEAATKLEELSKLNNRLPKTEIEKRLEAWKQGKNIE